MEGRADVDMQMDEDSMPQSQVQPQLQHPDSLFGAASLFQAFDQQHERLRATIENEFNNRLPLLASISPTPGVAPRQSASIWNLLQLRPSAGYQQSHDQHVIDTLLAKNNELQQHIHSLHATNHKLQQNYSHLENQYHSIRTELGEERLKSAELETKTQNLRAMLIPVSETQLSDGEVVSKFTFLRSQILKLVKSTWRRDRFKRSPVLTGSQRKVFGPFMENQVDMKYLDNRLRCTVFSFLFRYIFDKRNYALGGKFPDLEDHLGEFEDWMWKHLPTDRRDSIINWRMATMKATADFDQDKYHKARTVERDIWSFFNIFDFKSESTADEGKRMLEKICNDAVDLNMMMRNAKDEYFVRMMSGTSGRSISLCDDQEFAEEEASQPIRSQHPGSVAYYIHGALAKHPNGNLGDVKVLEKAQAVVYR